MSDSADVQTIARWLLAHPPPDDWRGGLVAWAETEFPLAELPGVTWWDAVLFRRSEVVGRFASAVGDAASLAGTWMKGYDLPPAARPSLN